MTQEEVNKRHSQVAKTELRGPDGKFAKKLTHPELRQELFELTGSTFTDASDEKLLDVSLGVLRELVRGSATNERLSSELKHSSDQRAHLGEALEECQSSRSTIMAQKASLEGELNLETLRYNDLLIVKNILYQERNAFSREVQGLHVERLELEIVHENRLTLLRESALAGIEEVVGQSQKRVDFLYSRVSGLAKALTLCVAVVLIGGVVFTSTFVFPRSPILWLGTLIGGLMVQAGLARLMLGFISPKEKSSTGTLEPLESAVRESQREERDIDNQNPSEA